MLLEHLVYSFAVALIAGMIYNHYTGRDPSWLIILGTIVPDIDYVLYQINYLITGNDFLVIIHGTFHNVLAVVVISLIVGFILLKIEMPFYESSIFFGIGMMCHFIEDSLVYANLYSYYYPFSPDKMGWGWINETQDIFHLAGVEVLIPGVALLCMAIIIRSAIDSEWSLIDYSYQTSNQLKYYTSILLNVNLMEDE